MKRIRKKKTSAQNASRRPAPSRIIIEGVSPEIDGGRFPAKRVVGETITVQADIFTEGHGRLAADLLCKKKGHADWIRVPMQAQVNDRWQAIFRAKETGFYVYRVEAWPDRFGTWCEGFQKKAEAGQNVDVERAIGVQLILRAAPRASRSDAVQLKQFARQLEKGGANDSGIETVSDKALVSLMRSWSDRSGSNAYAKELAVWVDRPKARFSTWYEFFPRSASPVKGRHGTFRDCEQKLSEIARMGFDVVYFPPIHPIGRVHRKGRNNSETAGPGDPGSPWAIGAKEGGHKSIHPELGSLRDFKRLVKRAQKEGIEVALDLAYQCTPDHPYVKEHPDWFIRRPDGTIQYAENPPKKYQDIYPINFECENWQALWDELKSIVTYWIEQGVSIFRVDNPHTKPYPFWEWLISEIHKDRPDVIFLAEAFTRPKVMHELAKIGFTQSYTYFTWRNTKWELEQYFTELTQTPAREFFRPNLWPNTPDILNEYLQVGGRPAFCVRLVLAATLGANYGMYGPAFELCENRPIAPGKEEYLDSEKYEIKHWDTRSSGSLREIIALVNRIRKENPALQQDHNLKFLKVDNDQIIAYAKRENDSRNTIITVVNLDPRYEQSGWVELPLKDLGIDSGQPYQMHDLLGGGRYLWQGPRNFIKLDPRGLSAHIFRVRHKVNREQDFDYYL